MRAALLVCAAGQALACTDYTMPGPTSAHLSVTPATGHVSVGGTMQLSASGGSGAVVWSSSDASVATVSFGTVLGVGSGTATIRAVSAGEVATSRIVVSRPAALALSGTSITLGGIAGTPSAVTDSSVVITDAGEDPLTGIAVGAPTYGSAGGWLSASVGLTSAPARLVLSASAASLAAGTYTATLPITATSATNGPLTVTVTFVVVRQAVIALGRTTAAFNGVQNDAAIPAAQQIAITNGGDAPLTGLGIGSIAYGSGASGWLNASVSPTAAPATLTLQPNTTALGPGDYSATLAVTSTLAGVAPATVTVSYHVANAPTPAVIVLSTSSLGFAATRTAALPAAQTVSVTDGGQVALTGLSVSVLYGAGSGWLDASLSSATAPATLTVQPNSASIAAGTYTATVRVSSSVAGVASRDVAVTYTIVDPPVIALSTTSASFSTSSAANPPAQQIDVSNSGGGTISGLAASVAYAAGQTAGWLSASVASSAPNAPSTTPLTLSVTASVVTPGTYTATVTLTATGAASRTVTVMFTRIATMSGDVYPLMSQSSIGCLSCHGTPPGPDNIDFSSALAAQTSLVNRVSPSLPTRGLVIPGNAASSYLTQILQGTATKAADNMPPGCTSGGTGCRPTLAQLVQVWINQGAQF